MAMRAITLDFGKTSLSIKNSFLRNAGVPARIFSSLPSFFFGPRPPLLFRNAGVPARIFFSSLPSLSSVPARLFFFGTRASPPASFLPFFGPRPHSRNLSFKQEIATRPSSGELSFRQACSDSQVCSNLKGHKPCHSNQSYKPRLFGSGLASRPQIILKLWLFREEGFGKQGGALRSAEENCELSLSSW